ncbi:MAG: glycerophosphodiester phosphodiesterase family protein, partial [Chitinophagaceae bacterium]
ASFSANLTALGFDPTIYSPHYSLVTPELVDACHRRKLKLIPWTVNTLAEMQRLKQLGVDGIISDYPNLYNTLQ